MRHPALLVILLALFAGCAAPGARPVPDPACGRIYLYPGIEAGPVSLVLVRQALRDAGYGGELRSVDWERPVGGLVNLTDIAGNRDRAAALADEIVAFQVAHPQAPVDLVGYSGGGGLAVLTAEALPPEARLRHVVLVQAALSRDYDLSAALARVDRQLVNFHVPSDRLILGVGTSVFGNIDRGHGPAAGKDGFDLEQAVPVAADRGRFRQVPWSGEMLSAGHLGTHMNCLGYWWNRTYVAPLLVGTL